jgi:hypothetical protein
MSRHKLQDAFAYPPRAMKVERAAAYLDVSRSKFLELVEAVVCRRPRSSMASASGIGSPWMLPLPSFRIAVTMIASEGDQIPSMRS